MKFQKLAFFRDAPAPWQATPPGGPVNDEVILVSHVPFQGNYKSQSEYYFRCICGGR